MPDVSAEACEELAQFLESEKFNFNMREAEAVPACGSAGCIGGHAAVLWPEVRGPSQKMQGTGAETFTWSEIAFSLKLGISDVEQMALCYLQETDLGWSQITRRGAAATLRRLGETGIVEWRAEEQV